MRHISPRSRLLFVIALAATAVLGVSQPAAAEPDDGNRAWSVRPAGADGQPDKRTHYTLQGAPGNVVKDQVLVTNSSKVKETFKIYATDAFNTSNGAFDLLSADKKPIDIGTWVTFPAADVTIDAGKSIAVQFAITIPKNATPGDHAGGVVVSLASGKDVRLDTRVAVRLYLRVPGYLRPTLAVQNLDASYQGVTNPFGKGKMAVTFTVVNNGNIRLQSHPKIRVSALGITDGHLTLADTPELLPGQRLTVSATVTGVFPAGLLNVSVELTPYNDPLQPVGQSIPTAVGDTDVLALSWLHFVLLLILAGGIYVLVRYLRLRRKRRAEEMARALRHAKKEARKEALAEAAAAKSAGTATGDDS